MSKQSSRSDKYQADRAKDNDQITKRSKNRQGSKSRKSTNDRNTTDFVCSAGKPTNDPRWYLNNPVLSRDVGSIWFSRPIGEPLPHVAIVNGDVPGIETDTYDPGIYAVPSMTTWGGTIDNSMSTGIPNNVLNLTAQKLYQFVVHANSRNISYDKKDLMMSIMAIDAIYQVITEAIRAYRLIAMYDPENKYVNQLLGAMNWSARACKENVAEFRYYINWAISRVNKFFVPKIFDIINAHIACYDNVYLDRPSNKAQMFVKYSAGVWIYDDVMGSLNYVNSWTSLRNFTLNWGTAHSPVSFFEVVSDMIARVEGSQYLGVMQGDLLKAFGFERMMQYVYVGIDEPLLPVYDEEFLYKLHNADICPNILASMFGHTLTFTEGGHTATFNTAMVYRDDNTVDGNFKTLMANLWMPVGFDIVRISQGTLIDLPTSVPATPENLLLMSLYKVFHQKEVTDTWTLDPDENPSTFYSGQTSPEVLLGGFVYLKPDGSSTQIVNSFSGTTRTSVAAISRFRHHPMITTATDTNYMPVWDTDNIGPVSYRLLTRMMDVIYWSLWASNEISSSESVRGSRT